MSDPRCLAILAPNWLGDAVMALPAIADLRRRFAGARIVVAARRSVADLALIGWLASHIERGMIDQSALTDTTLGGIDHFLRIRSRPMVKLPQSVWIPRSRALYRRH